VGGSISKDIIFVLDKSGSMGSENKFEQLQDSFREIIDQLPEDDRFSIIMFDDEIKVYSEDLLDATGSNKNDAIAYLDGMNADGGTNLYDSLEKALDMLTYSESRAPIIVMLTDGQPKQGKYTAEGPIREHIAGNNNIFCPIFSLGFGSDVNFDFLSALSQENYAKGLQIDPGEDAAEQIVNFYETISTTLLREITIEYPGAAHDYFPGSMPALYQGSEGLITGKIRLNETDDYDGTSGNFTTAFNARSAEGKRDFNATYTVGREDGSNEFIMRFWAYSKIYALMDRVVMESGDTRDATIAEIETLSIRAHFVTPYTALYVEIDEEDEGGDDDTGTVSGDDKDSDPFSRPPMGDDDDDAAEGMGDSPGFGAVLLLVALVAMAGRKYSSRRGDRP